LFLPEKVLSQKADETGFHIFFLPEEHSAEASLAESWCKSSIFDLFFFKEKY